MRIVSNPSEFKLSESVVSIGMFDGVHRGHRRVLRHLRDHGLALGLPTVLVTFDPHPLATLRPASCPALLSTLDGRMDLLASTRHVDYCVVLKFDRERSAVTAGDFVQETLVSKLGMRTLVVGENFACGRGRQGNVGYLVDLGVRLGFEVHPVPLRPQTCVERGTHCSSTEVRRLLRQGDIASANAMLDRAHELSTTVFGSRQSAARVIDVVVPSGMCLPPAGDYAGSVKKRGKTAPWIDAMLQIREDHPQFAERAVRLHLDRDMDAARGDAMVVRFLGKVNASIGDVAFAAAVAN